MLGDVLPLVRELKKRISSLPDVERVEIAGSIRRRKETVGDIDVLTVTSTPEVIMDYFVNMDLVGEVISQGPAKSTVRLKDGMEVDLRTFTGEDYGSALVYFTGSMELNVELRKIAISMGLKLNEYGVFKGEKQLAGRTEKDVFQALGLEYIEPELRENRGEVEAAKIGMLPELLELTDIQGDLHTHTNWSDGRSSVLEMAIAAKNMGLEYLAITDHTHGLPVADGLDENALRKQVAEIATVNDEIDGMKILNGAEVNIRADGQLDLDNIIMGDLDVVLAAIHSGVVFKEGSLTEVIIGVMENEHVDILAHPTGRKLKKRRAYNIDLEKVFEAAHDTGTILEVDSQPKRLDLNDSNVRMALKYGCKLVVDTDAHHTSQIDYLKLGVSTARRGWAQKKDVVNTLPLKKFLKALK